jgi:hypothetical protein
MHSDVAQIVAAATMPLDGATQAEDAPQQADLHASARAVSAQDPGAASEPLAPAPQPAAQAKPEPATGQTRSGFAPRTLAQLFDEPESVEPTWVLEDILPRGALAALVAKPKVGKTTLAYELAIRVAQGRPFLGRATTQGAVLILALEEHPREVKRRLRDLGAELIPDAVHVHIGPLTDSAELRHVLAQYITQHQIALVVVDTLNSFWGIHDENDATAVTQAIKPLLALARETDACILLVHHARKAEGEFGDEIRGSGALFSLQDVALILKRHEVETQRRLTLVSRYPETPRELVLELREHGYESLGDPAAVSKRAKEAKLLDALTDTPADARTLADRVGLPLKAVYPILEGLVRQGKATRSGSGRKGDPFRFAKIRFFPPSKDGPSEGTNFNLSNAPSGGMSNTPSSGQFVSSDPSGGPEEMNLSTLSGEEFVSSDPPHFKRRNETNLGAPAGNSFLLTPRPPGRNESDEPMEEVEL